MATVQKRIHELNETYTPSETDVFSSIYVAVDKSGYSSAKKMALSSLFDSSIHPMTSNWVVL